MRRLSPFVVRLALATIVACLPAKAQTPVASSDASCSSEDQLLARIVDYQLFDLSAFQEQVGLCHCCYRSSCVCYPCKPDPKHNYQQECQEDADALRAQAKAIAKAIASAPPNSLQLQDLQQQAEELQKEWNQLAAYCKSHGVDIGQLTGNTPAVAAGPPDPDAAAQQQQQNKSEYRAGGPSF